MKRRDYWAAFSKRDAIQLECTSLSMTCTTSKVTTQTQRVSLYTPGVWAAGWSKWPVAKDQMSTSEEATLRINPSSVDCLLVRCEVTVTND